jgi:hypothetical protein
MFAQGNLVQNGGFEDGISQNWSLFGEASNINYSLDTESAIEGVNCLKAELSQLGDNPWSIQIKNAFGPVEEGKEYKASIWIRSATNGSTVNYTIGKATAGYDEYASAYGVEVSTEWTRYSLQFTAQVSTSDDITLAMHITSADTYWFDDFKVAEMTGEVSDATVNETGNIILLEFAMNLAEPDENDQLPFFVYSQQRDYEVSDVSLSNKSTELNLVLAEPIYKDENITVEYIPGTLRTTAGVEISAFSIEALNNSEVPNYIANTIDNKEFKIYPVPFNDFLTIEKTGNHSVGIIKVFDSSGRVLLNSTKTFHSDIVQLNLGFLEAGMYYILIESEKRTLSVSKIVKN